MNHRRLNKFVSVVAAGALVATLGLSGCGSTGGTAEDTTSQTANSAPQQTYDVAIGHLNSTAHVLAFVAKEEGFFDEEGVNATLTQFSSASELVAGLESDKLDVAFIGSVPTIVNQSSGHDISVFGGAMTNGHGYVIKSKYTEGLDNWDVTILKGKNVAVPRTTIQELELYQILTKYGLTYGEGDGYDVKITYFDSQKDAYNAFASDEIDAVSTYSPYTSIAVADGASIVFQCIDEDIFQNQPCCRQVALTSALQNEPDKFTAYERAIIKAYDFFKTNPDKTVQDVKKYIDIPEDEIQYELYDANYGDSNPDPDKQATTELKDNAVAFGYTSDYDIDSHYNTSVYKNALDEVVAENPDNANYQALEDRFAQGE